MMEQPGWIKTENGLWLPTQYLEQVAPADEEIEVTFTAPGPLGLVLLPDSSPVLLAQVAPATAATFPALVPGVVLTTVQGRSIEGQRCADVVQQLKNSERPLSLSFQRFVSVGPPAWRPGQNIEAARDAVVAVGGHVTQGLGRAFGRLAGGLLGASPAAEFASQPGHSAPEPTAAGRTPARLGAWEITIAIPRVVSMTYYQMTVTVGQQQHWSIQKRWSQFLELDAHLRDAFQVRECLLCSSALLPNGKERVISRFRPACFENIPSLAGACCVAGRTTCWELHHSPSNSCRTRERATLRLSSNVELPSRAISCSCFQRLKCCSSEQSQFISHRTQLRQGYERPANSLTFHTVCSPPIALLCAGMSPF